MFRRYQRVGSYQRRWAVMEEGFKGLVGSSGLVSEDGGAPSSENVVKFPKSPVVRYDPLRDPELLDMMRSWFRAGEAVVFPVEVDCYRSHREAVEALSDRDVTELGLKVPCHLIRSPATEDSQRVDDFRYQLGVWEMRVTTIIMGAWLFGRRVDKSTLQGLMPDSDFDKIIPKLVEGGLAKIADDKAILPSRILLYRSMEQVAWLIDTMAPLVDKFCEPRFAGKMAHWPPFVEEIP